jgi:hypothetical protein
MKTTLICATLLFAASAGASPPDLRREIAAARLASPRPFAAVARLRARVAERVPIGRERAALARSLKSLGPHGAEALLEALGDESRLFALAPRAREVFLVGVVEALGALREPRAAPLLHSWFDREDASLPVARAVGEALGRLCHDREVAFLVARGVAGQRREREALSGLGHCRRRDAAAHLTARLDGNPDAPVATTLAEALGWLGSSWAWQAKGAAHAVEGEALRDDAARALRAAQTRYRDPETQARIADALKMVGR